MCLAMVQKRGRGRGGGGVEVALLSGMVNYLPRGRVSLGKLRVGGNYSLTLNAKDLTLVHWLNN